MDNLVYGQSKYVFEKLTCRIHFFNAIFQIFQNIKLYMLTLLTKTISAFEVVHFNYVLEILII